jgi:hypothetical protein
MKSEKTSIKNSFSSSNPQSNSLETNSINPEEITINKIKQLNENLYYVLQTMKKEIIKSTRETITLTNNNSTENNNNKINNSSINEKNKENNIKKEKRKTVSFENLISNLKLTEIEENIINQINNEKEEENKKNYSSLFQNLVPNNNKSIETINESFNYINEELINNIKEKMKKFNEKNLKVESFQINYFIENNNNNNIDINQSKNKIFEDFQSFVSFDNLSMEEQILLFSFIETKKNFQVIQNEKVSIKLPKKEVKFIPLNKILSSFIQIRKEIEDLKKENDNLKDSIEKGKRENEIKEENFKLELMKNKENNIEIEYLEEKKKNEELIKENNKLKDELMKMYIIKRNYDNIFQIKLKGINELNTNFKNEFNKNP